MKNLIITSTIAALVLSAAPVHAGLFNKRSKAESLEADKAPTSEQIQAYLQTDEGRATLATENLSNEETDAAGRFAHVNHTITYLVDTENGKTTGVSKQAFTASIGSGGDLSGLDGALIAVGNNGTQGLYAIKEQSAGYQESSLLGDADITDIGGVLISINRTDTSNVSANTAAKFTGKSELAESRGKSATATIEALYSGRALVTTATGEQRVAIVDAVAGRQVRVLETIFDGAGSVTTRVADGIIRVANPVVTSAGVLLKEVTVEEDNGELASGVLIEEMPSVSIDGN